MVMNKTKVALLSLSLLLAAPVYTEGNTTEQNISSQAIENKEEGKNSSEKLNEFIEKEKQQDKKSEEKNDSVEAKKTYYQRAVAVLASAGTMMKNSPGYVWGKTKALYNFVAGYIKGGYNWVTNAITPEEMSNARHLALNHEKAAKVFVVEKNDIEQVSDIFELIAKKELTEAEKKQGFQLLKATELNKVKAIINWLAQQIPFFDIAPFQTKRVKAARSALYEKLEYENLQEATKSEEIVDANLPKAKTKSVLEKRENEHLKNIVIYSRSKNKDSKNQTLTDVVKA